MLPPHGVWVTEAILLVPHYFRFRLRTTSGSDSALLPVPVAHYFRFGSYPVLVAHYFRFLWGITSGSRCALLPVLVAQIFPVPVAQLIPAPVSQLLLVPVA